MPAPLISGIVPPFNAAAVIARTLRSALDQSLAELEVVVVDDGSSDQTFQIVEGMAAADPRIHLHANDRNRGPSYTRNAAIAASAGRWIAVLDADDCMQRDRLATLVDVGETTAVDIVADNILFVHSHGSPAFDRLLPPSVFKDGGPRMLDPLSFLRMNPPGGNRGIGLIKPIIRAAVLHNSQIRYREDLRLAEDLFLYLELLLFGARMALIEPGMYEYLVRPDSLARSKSDADIERMIQSYDTMSHTELARSAPGVAEALQRDRDEMRHYSLPRHRLVRSLRQGRIRECWRVVRAHPLLPLEVIRRKLQRTAG